MFFLIVFTIITFLILLFIVKSDSSHDFFSPQILLTLFSIFFYVLPAFPFLPGNDYFTKICGIFFVGSSLTTIDRLNGITVSFMSYIFLLSGIYFSYLVSRKRISAEVSFKSEIIWNKINFFIVNLVYIIMGILEVLLLIRSTGGILFIVTNLGKKFEQLSGNYIFTFGYMFLGIVAFLLIFQKKRITKLFILLLITSILSAALLINRGLIVILLGSLILSFNYYIRPISFKKTLLIGAFGIFGAVSYKILQLVTIYGTSSRYFSLQNLASAMVHDLFGDVLIGPQQIAFALKGIPSFLDFQYGKTITGFLMSFIPSSFFPDKPVVSGAGIFTQGLFPYLYSVGTTVPPGLISELYMNFSFIGIIVGMFFFGVLMGSLYQSMKFRKSVFLIFLYSYSVTTFLYLLRGQFLLINRYIPFVLFFWLALRFSSKEKFIIERGK